jgi:hypothetical protein
VWRRMDKPAAKKIEAYLKGNALGQLLLERQAKALEAAVMRHERAPVSAPMAPTNKRPRSRALASLPPKCSASSA